jgi:mono/diheme cytochrome c family protein
VRYMLLLHIVWIALLLTSAAQNQAKSTVQDLPSSNTRAGEFRAEPSPERLARGRYVVEGPAHCLECHSESDSKNALGQPRPGTKGAGQIIKNEAFNGEPLPDGLVYPNITTDKETGAATWTVLSVSAPFGMESVVTAENCWITCRTRSSAA